MEVPLSGAAWIKAVNLYLLPPSLLSNFSALLTYRTILTSILQLTLHFHRFLPVIQNRSRWDIGVFGTYLLLLPQIERTSSTLIRTSLCTV